MNKSMHKLQLISNYPLLLNREEVLSQQQNRHNSTHSRGVGMHQPNTKLKQSTLNTQVDMRSTHTSYHDQINISKIDDKDDLINLQNKSTSLLQKQQQQQNEQFRNKATHLLTQSSILKTNGNLAIKNQNQNKNIPIKVFSPSNRKRNISQTQFFFASQRNTPKSNQDKRDFFQTMKSKTAITTSNNQRKLSDGSFLMLQKNDTFQYPLSLDMPTPKWNPNQLSSQINTETNTDSFCVSKQNYDIIKNHNVKLQKNYDFIKDQIMQALLLLEEEYTNSGKKDNEYKKSKDIILSLVNLLTESAKNELKLTLSNTQQLGKQEQIAQLKVTIEQIQQQLHYVQQENKTLISLQQENEKEILKKNREQLKCQKIMKADKRKIDQLEKRLELLLETNFVEYASNRATLNQQNNLKASPTATPIMSSTQFQQMLTASSSSSLSTQNLRILLSDLVKDNEQLKKDTLTLEIDILRYSENEQKLNKKIATLNQKIESMKKKISAKDLEQLHLEEKQVQMYPNQEIQQQQNSTNLLKRLVIPSDADFRINSLKFEYSQILMDLIEHGSNNFAMQVSRNKNADKRTKLISLMANQFISYRDFSNRFVQTVKALHEFEQIDDLTIIQQKVSLLFPSLFKADTARLWISDSITGIMYTYNHQNKKINCFPGKGIFQDVIRGRLPMNMKNSISNRYIYIQMNEGDDNLSLQLIQQANLQSQNNINLQSNNLSTYNCLTAFCLPIIIDEDVIGILEISDNSKQEGFGQDEELFGVVSANFLSSMIRRIKVYREQLIQIKYTDLVNNCFKECLDSESLLILEQKIHSQVQVLFGVDICKFYFVKEANQIKKQIQNPTEKETNFSSFYSLVTQKAFSYQKGLVGEAISTMKSILVNSAQTSNNFDPFVDVKTLLPIYTTPLFVKIETDNTQECVGVLQIPLKKRTKIAREKDKLLLGATPLLGIDNSLENQIKNYSSLIAQAIKFIISKEKK